HTAATSRARRTDAGHRRTLLGFHPETYRSLNVVIRRTHGVSLRNPFFRRCPHGTQARSTRSPTATWPIPRPRFGRSPDLLRAEADARPGGRLPGRRAISPDGRGDGELRRLEGRRGRFATRPATRTSRRARRDEGVQVVV